MECVCSPSLSTQIIRHLLGGRALVGRLVRPRDRRALHILAEDDRLARRELLALGLARLRRLARRVLLAARDDVRPGRPPRLERRPALLPAAPAARCTSGPQDGVRVVDGTSWTPSLSFRSRTVQTRRSVAAPTSRRPSLRLALAVELRLDTNSSPSCSAAARQARRVAVLRQVGVLPPGFRPVTSIRAEVARPFADVLRRSQQPPPLHEFE